jgi:hypothetical protein
MTPAATPTERALTAALERLYREGYQPMYNGRPSCPFCGNFVDDEETHTAGCVLRSLDAERAARAPEGEPEWPALANDIRRIDGNHDMGAGALAEALTQAGWSRAARAEPGRERAALDSIFSAFDKSNNVPMFLAATIRHERAALEAHGEPQEGER